MKKLRLYSFAKATLGRILKFTMRIKVSGNDLEYTDGGCIICANHTHLFDCVVLAIAIRSRQLRFLAKKEVFSIPIVSSLARWFGAYSVDRSGSDVGAIKKTISLLEDGCAVGIFPQGTRCPGKEPRDTSFKSGAAMAAYHAHVPITPVFIKVKNRRYRFLRKKEVIIGAPITWEELGFSEDTRPDYKKATEIIKDRICSLESEVKNDK